MDDKRSTHPSKISSTWTQYWYLSGLCEKTSPPVTLGVTLDSGHSMNCLWHLVLDATFARAWSMVILHDFFLGWCFSAAFSHSFFPMILLHDDFLVEFFAIMIVFYYTLALLSTIFLAVFSVFLPQFVYLPCSHVMLNALYSPSRRTQTVVQYCMYSARCTRWQDTLNTVCSTRIVHLRHIK